MTEFVAGKAWCNEDTDSHTTYAIDQPGMQWSGRILVYGSEKLRDHIVKLLNDNPLPKSADYTLGWNEAIEAAASEFTHREDREVIRALKRSKP